MSGVRHAAKKAGCAELAAGHIVFTMMSQAGVWGAVGWVVFAFGVTGCVGAPINDHSTQVASVGGSEASVSCSTGGSSVVLPGIGGTPAAGGNAATGGTAPLVSSSQCVDVCNRYGSPCCQPSLGCVTPEVKCTIEIMAGGVGTIYQYSDLEKAVEKLPADVLATLEDTDFDWVAVDPPVATRMQLHLTASASERYASALLERYPIHPFRVKCGGNSLFVGVMYVWYGQAALQTPVMDAISGEDGKLSLYLGAWEGAWAGLGNRSPEAQATIDRPELRSVFCRRGALRELAADALPPNP